jgi:glutaredoxin 3
MNIVVYTQSKCPNCKVAKDILNSKGIGFEERNAEDVTVFLELTKRYPEVRQMPQIFIEGQRVGGLAGLQAALTGMGL